MLETIIGLAIMGVLVLLVFLWKWLEEKDLEIWVLLGMATLIMARIMGTLVLELI